MPMEIPHETLIHLIHILDGGAFIKTHTNSPLLKKLNCELYWIFWLRNFSLTYQLDGKPQVIVSFYPGPRISCRHKKIY